MKKYLLIYKPQCNIYQVDVNLYDSEEEAIVIAYICAYKDWKETSLIFAFISGVFIHSFFVGKEPSAIEVYKGIPIDSVVVFKDSYGK